MSLLGTLSSSPRTDKRRFSRPCCNAQVRTHVGQVHVHDTFSRWTIRLWPRSHTHRVNSQLPTMARPYFCATRYRPRPTASGGVPLLLHVSTLPGVILIATSSPRATASASVSASPHCCLGILHCSHFRLAFTSIYSIGFQGVSAPSGAR
jgi:hypothetical protein